MAEDAGVEIPKGHPDRLREAGTGWAALAEVLSDQATRMESATRTVVGADWSGDASRAYAGYSALVSVGFIGAAGSCRQVHQACARFASDLADAQHRARKAKHDAEDAITRRDAARRAAADAQGRADAAGQAIDSAAHRATVAAAAGPAGASSLASAQADGHAAGVALDDAQGDLRRASTTADQAQHDLDAARKAGRKATEDAAHAARAAGHAFAAVAGAVPQLPLAGAPTVPVSLRGAKPDIAALDASFGNPFLPPGMYGSPAQARAAQIARARQAAQAAEDADGPRKGSILDGLSGLVNGETFGLVDLGGDKRSGRYRGGELASFIPVSPSGVVKDLGKGGERVLLHGAERELAHGGGQDLKYWAPKEVLGHKVYQRDDLIDPLLKDKRGRTNLERMAKGDPPIGPDGKSINLHHTLQTHDGPLAEVEATFHTRNGTVLHINLPQNRFPSGIDRPAFEKWKDQYWRERGVDFQPPETP
jgi:hypothetical protein